MSMNAINTTEFVNVVEKAHNLGCNSPTGIALLPRNFDSADTQSELVHEESVLTVRKLWKKAGVIETPLAQPGTTFPPVRERSFNEWMGPIIFVSYALWNGNEYQISMALNVISDYLTDFFKGMGGNNNVRLEIVSETKGGDYRSVQYRGAVEGLSELPAIVREVAESER